MYEDDRYFYLILDLISGGEMFEHLIEHGAYSEKTSSYLLRDVAAALNFLHGVGIVHADLKPENLMLSSWDDDNSIIKLVDFGCATLTDDGNTPIKAQANKSDTGTTAYWPPECFDKTKSHTAPSIDMWSLGVILYIMLTGIHPFDPTGMATDEDIEETIKKNPEPPFNKKSTGHLSPSAVDLIKKLMCRDPEKRLTASEMLQHPWIKGDTATDKTIAGSHTRIKRFKELRDKLESGIFTMMIAGGAAGENNNMVSGSHRIIERAYELMDADHKGFVSTDDMSRVLTSAAGIELSDKEKAEMNAAVSENKKGASSKEGMDFNSFNNLMAGLETFYFKKGEVIFKEGDKGDCMYFVNSGKVQFTIKNTKVGTLHQGAFFGEGSMLNPDTMRSASAICLTPVEVMQIKRADYERYIKNSSVATGEMKLVRAGRMLQNAKGLIRLQNNVKEKIYTRGECCFKEKDEGNSMFTVQEGGGEFRVVMGGVECGKLKAGDMFGETALLMHRPRSATVECVSDECKVLEMRGKDFLELLSTSPEAEASLRDLSRRREFQKALLKMVGSAASIKELFDAIDTDGDGALSTAEVKEVFRKFDTEFPENEVQALVESMDLDGSGNISWKEFQRVVGLGVR
jgi:serine/threonine protein kinase/CRP-like cAMP-binding protein